MLENVFRIEYIEILFLQGEAIGIAEWERALASALERFDLQGCQHLLRFVKRQQLSAASVATIKFNQGLIYSELLEDWNQSLSSFKDCLAIRRSLTSESEIAQVLYQIGCAYRRIFEYTSAQNALLEGLAVAESCVQPATVTKCLRELGYIYETYGEYETAKNMYTQSIQSDSAGLEWDIAQGRFLLGLIEQIRGNYAEAKVNYEASIRAMGSEHPRGNRIRAEIEYQTGTICYEQGSLEKAQEHLEEALTLLQNIGMSGVLQGHVLYGLGLIHQDRGQRREALQSYEEAEATFKELGSKEEVARIFLQKGEIEISRGQPKNAIDHLESALEVFLKIHNSLGVSDAHYSLGKVFGVLQEYSRAFDHLNEL